MPSVGFAVITLQCLEVKPQINRFGYHLEICVIYMICCFVVIGTDIYDTFNQLNGNVV